MNNIFDIEQIVNSIPLILEYFIPGFIFISFSQYLLSKSLSQHYVILSIVLSYLLKSIFSVAHNYFLVNRVFLLNERIIILSCAALIFSVLFVKLYESKKVNYFFMMLNNKSLHDNIWDDVIDYKNGTTVRAICSDAEYVGYLEYHEEKGNDSWMVLRDYIIYEDEEYRDAADFEYPSRIAIKMSDIKRLELYYAESEK